MQLSLIQDILSIVAQDLFDPQVSLSIHVCEDRWLAFLEFHAPNNFHFLTHTPAGASVGSLLFHPTKPT